MSQDQERIKGMIALKQRLEKRLAKMDAETKELQATLDTVNTILLEKGFRRVNIKDAESVPQNEPAAQAKQLLRPKKVDPRGIKEENPKTSSR